MHSAELLAMHARTHSLLASENEKGTHEKAARPGAGTQEQEVGSGRSFYLASEAVNSQKASRQQVGRGGRVEGRVGGR